MLILNIYLLIQFTGCTRQIEYKSTFNGSSEINCKVGPDQKFKTITSAMQSMKEGETCIINEGIYREQLEIKKSNIKLIGNGHVIVTGNDIIENMQSCEINGQNCFKKSIQTPVYDVFCNNQYMMLSRFPNKTFEMTSNKDWHKSYIGQQGNIGFSGQEHLKLTNLKDGYYVGMHGPVGSDQLASWYSISAPITGVSDGGYISVDRDNVSSGYLGNHGKEGGIGYIIGAKAALNHPGEWYTDGKEVILIPPTSDQVHNNCEFRTRLYSAIIKSDGVHLENIHFKSGLVNVEGNNISIYNSIFEYISPFRHIPHPKGSTYDKTSQSLESVWGTPEDGTAGVFVSGNGFTVKSSIFSKSWWAGMTIRGNDALVENCLFEDINWMARRSAGLFSWGDKNVVRNNTFRKLGAAALEGGNSAWIEKYATNNIWEYNFIENATKLVVDQGLFYVNHQLGGDSRTRSYPRANSTWRYNVGIGSDGPQLGNWKKITPGLYVDNNSSGYRIHNNIIIKAAEGVRYNDFIDGERAGKDIWIYNNTFINSGALPAIGQKHKTNPDVEIYLYNNLAVNSPSNYFANWNVLQNHGKRSHNKEFNSLDPLNLTGSLDEVLNKASGTGLFKNANDMDFTPINNLIASDSCNVGDQEIKYVGAVNPAVGMWSFGADESLLPILPGQHK